MHHIEEITSSYWCINFHKFLKQKDNEASSQKGTGCTYNSCGFAGRSISFKHLKDIHLYISPTQKGRKKKHSKLFCQMTSHMSHVSCVGGKSTAQPSVAPKRRRWQQSASPGMMFTTERRDATTSSITSKHPSHGIDTKSKQSSSQKERQKYIQIKRIRKHMLNIELLKLSSDLNSSKSRMEHSCKFIFVVCINKNLFIGSQDCRSLKGAYLYAPKIPREESWVFPKIVVPQNGWFIMENPF